MQVPDILTSKRLRHLEAMVAEITPEELNSKIIGDEIFVLIDISDGDDYKEGHLPGATHIPMISIVEEAVKRYRKWQQIIIYCEEMSSSIAIAACKRLQRVGFSNVQVLRGGKEAWKNSGFKLVSEEEDKS